MSFLSPRLTPHGVLLLEPANDAAPMAQDVSDRLQQAFSRGHGHGLLQLGAAEVKTELPPTLAYWREFGARYVTAVCSLTDPERVEPLLPSELEWLAAFAPPMTGAEYLTAAILRQLWEALDSALRIEHKESKLPLQDFLKSKNPAWNLVGRVHFNLAENRNDEAAPFAFLATYTARLSAGARAQHVPLGRALEEYAGAANRARLLSLLVPVQRAAEQCGWLREMVGAGEIYHPLRWTPNEAFQLLRDLPKLEQSGVIVRVPGAWKDSRPPRPRVGGVIGGKKPAGLGQEALLDFQLEVTLDGEQLSQREIEEILSSAQGLHLLRGRWVEVDPESLRKMLDRFRDIETIAAESGLGFTEAARLLSGAGVGKNPFDPTAAADWSQVTAGPWLAEQLEGLRHPEALAAIDPGSALKAELRPYQQLGLRWLHLLSSLRLGACLADDMGLGKTMQVLALLVVLQRRRSERHSSLLVAPASLLANWVAEAERFAPGLKTLVAHPSAMPSQTLQTLNSDTLKQIDLVMTTYGTLLRAPNLVAIPWRLAIADEAQAIKNPAARQTRAVKDLKATARIALTGTPVENKIGDLWSIFDFINPGLLGSAKSFSNFAKSLGDRQQNPYGPLKELVRPYILRRLKTDKTVIADLPEKTEINAYCHLAKRQAAFYQEAVSELARKLDSTDEGIQRRGIVLSYLMRFKQICNHPSQWLGDNHWKESDSGKLGRLREIAEVIGSRQEKVLVFTQFRETCAPLASFLGSVFGRPGLVLHGETPVRQRKELVEQFQKDERVPFFVISLKAGGFGLNLTAASHVIHFDRWWNPAVENQATDRAFRIGQTKNVLVHKFLCRGTVEEKIEQLMEFKRQISEDLLGGGAEKMVTEMSNDELLKLVSLDLSAVAGENE